MAFDFFKFEFPIQYRQLISFRGPGKLEFLLMMPIGALLPPCRMYSNKHEKNRLDDSLIRYLVVAWE